MNTLKSVVGLLCLCISLQGCTAFTKEINSRKDDIAALFVDAQNIIQIADALFGEFKKERGVTGEQETQYVKLRAAVLDALGFANASLQGVQSLTSAKYIAAFTQFNEAWDQWNNFINALGIQSHKLKVAKDQHVLTLRTPLIKTYKVTDGN